MPIQLVITSTTIEMCTPNSIKMPKSLGILRQGVNANYVQFKTDFGHYETRSGLVSLWNSHDGPTTKFMGHATSCSVPVSDIAILQPLAMLVISRAKKKVGFTRDRDIFEKI